MVAENLAGCDLEIAEEKFHEGMRKTVRHAAMQPDGVDILEYRKCHSINFHSTTFLPQLNFYLRLYFTLHFAAAFYRSGVLFHILHLHYYFTFRHGCPFP